MKDKKGPMNLNDQKDKKDQGKGGDKKDGKDQDKKDQAKDGGKDDQKDKKKDEDKLAKKDGGKDDKKDKDKGDQNGKGGGKDGKGGDGLGTNKKDDPPKKETTLADQKLDVWGHLPQNRRKEMDAFQRERYMPRYEELLRAYYRNIAESGRKKDD